MLRNRRSLIALLGVVAIVGSLLVVLPASGSEQVLRLHIDDSSAYFGYDGGQQQPLATAKNGCQLTSSSLQPVVNLAAGTPNGAKPGLSSLSIGVKGTSSSNGTPCSQVDSQETLILTPGSAFSGRFFSKVRLDLELTGNAIAELTVTNTQTSTSRTYRLQTGTSITPDQSSEPDYDPSAPYEVESIGNDVLDACAAPNSSGPNSNINDNCLWLVDPEFDFNRIILTTSSSTPGGTVSLEGGSDFLDGSTYDSLFYLANAAPVARADTYDATEDNQLSVPAETGVLANDSDADDASITAVLVSNVPSAAGSVALNGDGSFTYTPALNFDEPTSFTYKAFDGSAYSPDTTVTINVAAVNDPPVANADSMADDYDATEDNQLSVPAETGVLANDTDVDGPSLTAVLVSNVPSAAGSVALNGDGSFTYTPALNFDEQTSFTYKAFDGSAYSAVVSVTIDVAAVNDPPTVVDNTQTATEDTPATFTPSQLASDVEGDPLFIRVTSGPTNGSYSQNEDGSITYTPNAGFNGPDSFDYEACEVGSDPEVCSSGTATVTVQVASVNDAPVAVDDDYEVNEFSSNGTTVPTLTVPTAMGVLANDSDPADSPPNALSAVSLDTTGTTGSVTLNADGSFTYSPSGSYLWADDEFSYEDTFTYRARDNGVPPLDSEPATVTVTVYRVICSDQEVTASDGDVSGTFQRLTDPEACKRYTIDADEGAGEVLFEPSGGTTVYYRGFLTFGDDTGATAGGGSGTFSIGLVYDPDGPSGPLGYRALIGCETPQLDGDGNVLPPGEDTTTGIPDGETWCIASFRGIATTSGSYAIEWQVLGEGDPGFKRG